MASSSSRSLARFAAPGVLLLASLVLFGGGLLPGHAFFYRDVLHYYWPMQATHVQLGLVPQWDSFHQGGLPFLANIHAGVLYPPNLLFTFLSFPTAYALLLLAHHFAAQLGLLVFLRRQGFEDAPALTGALAFGLTGYVAGLCNAGPILLGLAWMPWVLVTLHTPLPPLRKLGVLALLIAAQLLSGDPQSALYSALVAAASVAWFPERKTQLVALAGGGALGLLLAGVQVLPALHLLTESTRGSDASDYLSAWNLHPLRLFELAFPYPFGEYLIDPQTHQPQFWANFTVKGPGSVPFALSVYLGVTVLGLAVLGTRRERLTGFALSLCAGGLLLALGEHSPLAFLLALPPFRLFRYPEKYVVLVALGCAVLAASGTRALLTVPSRRRLLVPTVAAALMLGTLLFLWVVPGPALAAATSLLQSVQSRRNPQDVLTSTTHALGTSLVFMAALLGLAGWALRRPGARGIAVGLVALVAVDLLWTARSTVWLGPPSLFLEPELATRLHSLVGTPPTRLFRMDKSLKELAPRSYSMPGLLELRRFEVGTLKSNLAGAFGLEEVTSYGAVELRRWRALMNAFATRPAKVASLYSGCLLLTSSRAEAAEREGTEPVLSEPSSGLQVSRLTACPPRLRTVTRTTAVATLDEAVALLTSGRADGLQEVPVEEGETKTYAPAPVDGVELGPRSARAHVVAAPGGTFLVFATSFYPGWTASVDGHEAPVHAVDGALMGLEVPEGSHQVEFTFTDPGVGSGLQASLAGAVVLGMLWLLARRGEAPAPPREPLSSPAGPRSA